MVLIGKAEIRKAKRGYPAGRNGKEVRGRRVKRKERNERKEVKDGRRLGVGRGWEKKGKKKRK
jgi:hypothetical protein